MFKKGILLNVILFVVVVLLLLIVIPVISSILKQLIILQIIIVIAGAIVLRFIVQRIRNKAQNQETTKKYIQLTIGFIPRRYQNMSLTFTQIVKCVFTVINTHR